MPALTPNPDLLIKGFVRDAKDEDNPIAWTRAIQKAAMTAWRAGDEYASTVSSEGSATSWLRDVPAGVLASMCEAVLLQLEAEADAEEAGLDGIAQNGIRYADASREPALMG